MPVRADNQNALQQTQGIMGTMLTPSVILLQESISRKKKTKQNKTKTYTLNSSNKNDIPG